MLVTKIINVLVPSENFSAVKKKYLATIISRFVNTADQYIYIYPLSAKFLISNQGVSKSNWNYNIGLFQNG